MNLGNKISILRKQNNLTQAELADSLSVSHQAVSQWENSNTYPDITMLPEIAKIFNVSLDELFDIQTNPIKTINFNGEFDKDTLYCVVTKGNTVLCGEELNVTLCNKKITFEYKGEALNVISHMNLVCNNVSGNVKANGSVSCDGVGGNVKAMGSVNCNEVNESVSAGGSITCDDIKGDAKAGGSINCNNIGGNVSAGGSIRMKY